MKIYYCKLKPSLTENLRRSNYATVKHLEERLIKFEHFDSIPSNSFKRDCEYNCQKKRTSYKKICSSQQSTLQY